MRSLDRLVFGFCLAVILTLAMFAGAARAQDVPAVRAFECLPIPSSTRVKVDALPPGISTRATAWAVWICETPAGWRRYAWVFNPADVVAGVFDYVRGAIGLDAANVRCAASCWPSLTKAENDFAIARALEFAPIAKVATAGSSRTRDVFALGADGSIDRTKPLAGQAVAVGDPCDWSVRAPKSPTFYSVKRRPNARGGAALGDVFAVCAVSMPGAVSTVGQPVPLP